MGACEVASPCPGLDTIPDQLFPYTMSNQVVIKLKILVRKPGFLKKEDNSRAGPRRDYK